MLNLIYVKHKIATVNNLNNIMYMNSNNHTKRDYSMNCNNPSKYKYVECEVTACTRSYT